MIQMCLCMLLGCNPWYFACGKINDVNSSRYLYVCATTLCTYIGVFIVAATGIYTHLVLAMRKRKQVPISNNTR